MTIAPFLESRAIPYAIGPCTELAQEGLGVRDKVYFIIKHYSERELWQRTRHEFGATTVPDLDAFSFYRFSKSPIIHPEIMEEKLITPLFEAIPNVTGQLRQDEAYLNWQEIKQLSRRTTLVTILNHSHRHVNMSALSAAEIKKDVGRSIDHFRRYLQYEPSYYAVPFGSVSQTLAYDLTTTLRDYNYKGVLWVAGGSNKIKRPYRAQLIHLSRIHAPTTMRRFITTLAKSIKARHSSILSHIPKSNSRRRFSIASASNVNTATAFENLARPGKDYSSDKEYYAYMFPNNPYGRGLPDYHYVEADGRLESILYRFPIPWSLNNCPVPGAIVANWRQLPVAPNVASGLLLHEILKTESIVGAYRPSSKVWRAFSSWKRQTTYEYTIATTTASCLTRALPADWQVRSYDNCPEVIEGLASIANATYLFSVRRSSEFYKWRYDQYPLAHHKYLVLHGPDAPLAYFVLLYKDTDIYISDFFCDNASEFEALLNATSTFASTHHIPRLRFETSLRWVTQYMEEVHKAQPDTNHNFFYFNTTNKDMIPDLSLINEKWDHIDFHETQACGDILLRRK